MLTTKVWPYPKAVMRDDYKDLCAMVLFKVVKVGNNLEGYLNICNQILCNHNRECCRRNMAVWKMFMI